MSNLCAFAQLGVSVVHKEGIADVDPVVDEAGRADRVAALHRAQGARIRDLRKAKGLTIDELATRSGLHFNTVGRIERGMSEASLEQQLAIAETLGVPMHQLNAAQPPANSHAQADSAIDEDAFVLIDLLDVRVSGGAGAVNGHTDSIGRFAFNRAWLSRKGVQAKHAKIVRVRGDSMADKINNGDILLVDVSRNTLDQEGVYVIELGGEDYVKVLQRDFATGGIRIVSYNEKFPPQVLPPEKAVELRITGLVVWHAGEL